MRRLLCHDFRKTRIRVPLIRQTMDECDQIAHLRGIVHCLEFSRRSPPREGSTMVDYDAYLRLQLEEIGITLKEAKRIVYPDPTSLPRSIRKEQRIPKSYDRRARPRAPRASRSVPQAAEAAAPEATSPEPSETPPAGDDGAPAPSGGWEALPVVLTVEDLARVFDVSLATARRHLVAGDYGPRLKLGRRWLLRTEDLRAHLGTLAEQQTPPAADRDAAARRWRNQLKAQRQRARRNGRRK